MAYYPITLAEIGEGAQRAFRPGERYTACTVPVREDVRLTNGKTFPSLAWGAPSAYEIREVHGKLYACRKWDWESPSGPDLKEE